MSDPRRQKVIDSKATQAAEAVILAHLHRVYALLRRTTVHRDLIAQFALLHLVEHPADAKRYLSDYLGERQAATASLWLDDELDALLQTAHDRLTAALGTEGAGVLALHPNSDYNGKFILYVAVRAYADALAGEGEGS